MPLIPASASLGAGATAPVEVAFHQRSYRPGEQAVLVVRGSTRVFGVQLYRAGSEQVHTRRRDELRGVPVGPELMRSGHRIHIRIPGTRSGSYFARVTHGASIGYAPFVLRPARLGASRVAVVLPTNTWQAYNFRDDDGDGQGDTWYANSSYNGVDLTRPYLDRGVPPFFTQYDLGFLRWLTERRLHPDFLADDDLDRLRGGDLARLYDLVIFPGHEEYVTERVWNAVRRYRDLGGNIAFLSANNFFYRVERRGQRLYRTGRWRDLGYSEARLKGVEYVGYYEGKCGNRPYVVTGVHTAPWFFERTGLRNGDRFGRYGIEVDRRTADSPPGTIVLARIRNIFGPGRSGEMTYYETRAGAKVFSAGVMNFGGSAERLVVSTLLDNLWRWLTNP